MCQRDSSAGGRFASSTIPRELRESYTRAVYRVDSLAAPIFLRVGGASAELDGWLEAQGVSRFAFLSAANPGSVALGESENRRRHQRLVERLRAGGFATLGGESFEAASGGWREASLLVAGIDRDAAIGLARDFGQLALLWGEIGKPVELLLTTGKGASG